MYTWLDKYVYMYTYLCIQARYLCLHVYLIMYTCILNYVYMQNIYVYMQDDYVYMYR